MNRILDPRSIKYGVIALTTAPLAACTSQPAPQTVSPPRLELTCPDPSDRIVLREGSSYRDLAKSRAEAVAGWTECHGALAVSK